MASHGIRVLVLTNMYPTTAAQSSAASSETRLRTCAAWASMSRCWRSTGAATSGGIWGRPTAAPSPATRTIRHRACPLRAVRRRRRTAGRTPVVTTFHGSDAWVPWQRTGVVARCRRTQPIAVASVIAASLGVRDAPVIPCAVDLELFVPIDRAEARRALGWPEAGPCVLFPAARTDRRKCEQAPRRLRCDGGASAPERVGRLRGQPRRPLPGSRSPCDERRRRGRVDVHAGGRPMVVKEALACETPVVSVAVGDVSAMVAGLPGCAIVPCEPAGLAKAVGGALGASRDIRLRESMQVYGRQQIAERVLGRLSPDARREGGVTAAGPVRGSSSSARTSRRAALSGSGRPGPGLAERGFDLSVLTLDGRGAYFDALRARGVAVACAAPAAPRRPGRAGSSRPARAGRLLRRRHPRRECAHGRPRPSLVPGRPPTSSRSTSARTRSGCERYAATSSSCSRRCAPRVNAVVAVASSQIASLVGDGYRP